MAVIITNVTLSKETVNVNEVFKVSVTIKETVTEPNMYRMPYRLGTDKGGIK